MNMAFCLLSWSSHEKAWKLNHPFLSPSQDSLLSGLFPIFCKFYFVLFEKVPIIEKFLL
jgi:hypothetical protein